MFKSYLIIAFRNLVAHKLYSAINVLGLAIGLTCFILIALFLRHEVSYDKHWTYADQIWRITTEYWNVKSEPGLRVAASPIEAGPALRMDFPEIEYVGRIGRLCGRVSREELTHYESGCTLADAGIFDIFDFEFIRGGVTGALTEPSTAILTESLARKYFGDEDPIGQTLRLDYEVDVRVIAVIRDLPETTHLAIDMMVSLSTLDRIFDPESIDGWEDSVVLTYVRLPADYDIQQLVAQLPAFIERHIYEDASESYEYHPQRVTDIHLRSNVREEMKGSGSLTAIYAFGIIATFVLLIACINFMNLSAARSLQRAREVGMRKVMGAQRSQLITQFLGEAFLLCSIAAFLAIALVEMLLPAFSTFIGGNLEFDYFGDPLVAVSLVGLTLVVGLVAGSYAAFFLSALTPASVLKGEVTRGRRGASFRKALVVFQFAISISLIVATSVVHAQIRYALDQDLGFRKERMLIVAGSKKEGMGAATRTMRDEWLRHPEVLSVTASARLPGHWNGSTMTARVEGTGPDDGGVPDIEIPDSGLNLTRMWVDFNFFEAYDIEIVAGRAFSEDFPADQVVLFDGESNQSGGAFILSEFAAKQFGLTPEAAIGRGFVLTGFGPEWEPLARGTIVGVARDTRFASAREAIRPVFYMVPPEMMWGFQSLSTASILLTGNQLEETLEHIDATFRKFVRGETIYRVFLDESFESLYKREKHQREALMYFALLAIVIACMGLFGLASFTAERRTKEIGIRKVMGATVWDIVKLVSWEFSQLVLIANAIAWPVAYFAMHRWLSGFVYRIDLNPLIFLGAGLAALLLAWLTVSGLAARVANARPVLALRYE